jgi:hypothetical protein
MTDPVEVDVEVGMALNVARGDHHHAHPTSCDAAREV